MVPKLINYNNTPYKSVNLEHLERHTIKISLEDFELLEFDWTMTRELHIIGNSSLNSEYVEIENDYFGVYLTEDKQWILILCDSSTNDLTWLNLIDLKINILDIRFLEIEKFSLLNMSNVSKLVLSNNKYLKDIQNIEKLIHLRHLELSNTNINTLPHLIQFQNLNSLNLRNTKIDSLDIPDVMHELRYLDISGTLIFNLDFISMLPSLIRFSTSKTEIVEVPIFENNPELEMLNFSHTRIANIPSLKNLSQLKSLNLAYTLITSTENLELPLSITKLVLEGTGIKEVTSNICTLANLRKLVLANMKLMSIPKEILALNLEFNFKNRGFGICLQDTIIDDMDISILEQPRVLIESWFNNRKLEKESIGESNPLNEVKIVFLGDGGSGKSLTIERMLSNGDIINNFNGDSTPGISIKNKLFETENKSILVHFWDFGGQEIMHSMHRMFLTRRTLYVIFVNARDNTQDERARYWLQNIKSFANGSSVIIVLNQIDQNPSATVNEPALKALYPHLRAVIKLSATTFNKTTFNYAISECLISEIMNLPYVNEPFLSAWRKLKSNLQNMKEYYIDNNLFQNLCDDCGVDKSKDVRMNLLEWFGDLGISFYYKDNNLLSNYMVLRPDWITNAIYIILFNGIKYSNNGLIKIADVINMLRINDMKRDTFKRVFDNITYSAIETEYVLGVIRRFRLSYRMDEEYEFIPMLCDRNENIVINEFLNKRNILEFNVNYEYLPNNVLHRLMVELRHDLLHEYVWMTGAVFSLESMELKALVKSEDNKLIIYVKSNSSLYQPSVYLGFIRNTIKNINRTLGLTYSESIVYKLNEQTEEFDYEYLIESYNHGNREIFSKRLKKNIVISDILNQVDGETIKRKDKLVKDILEVCMNMQANKLYWNCTEDYRNTYVRDMLRSHGYFIADQTLRGKSGSGKLPGELDIEIYEKPNVPIAVYEALNLSAFNEGDKRNWNDHLLKLIDNYNPMGLPNLFLVSYVTCSKDNYKDYWLKYYEYLSQNCCLNYTIQNVREMEVSYFYVRCAECTYDRAGVPTIVYHICVRLGD